MILVANQTSHCSDSDTAFFEFEHIRRVPPKQKWVMYLSPLGVAGLQRVEPDLHSRQTCHAFIG